MTRPTVLILDFGSQTTQLIARRVREERVYSEIHPCTIGLDAIRAMAPRAVILSGGPASVFADGAPSVDRGVFELGVPVLGICYGMQLISHLLGGEVEAAGEREYGPAELEIVEPVGILAGFAAGETTNVWMSHGDRVRTLPPGFRAIARSKNAPFAACADPARGLFGVQFHPEVVHTERGRELLRAFLFDVAKLEASWTSGSLIEEAIAKIREQVGEGRAICGLSGGVDSSVAAVLVARAIGERLTCVFVDTGLMRKDEAREVVRMFDEHIGVGGSSGSAIRLVHVDASARFLEALAGITDPEAKRKTIGRLFIEVFEEEARKLEGEGRAFTHLVQGTLYPDVIESVSFKGPSATIKTHHNVGGLPERMQFALVEPLRELFKDEVREVGEALGLPHHVVHRHPFPGPGLAIRVLGEVTRERLDVLREADAIFIEELRRAGASYEAQYDRVWQAFAVLLPVRSVGVMGDGRTYENVCAIRAVGSKDGMTADWSRLPYELLARVSSRVINEVKGINRVVYDISSKPPATIEWE